MTITRREPYPLQWPESWPRAKSRGVPQFVARFAQDRDHVIRQLRMRGGNHIVITSDLPTRNDGLPYANATCQDPGIAVWWVEKGKEHVMACDRWRTVSQNLRAIDKSLEALRALDRWGAAEVVDRAFAGFAALPPGSPTPEPPRPAMRSWRDVFDVDATVYIHLPDDDLLAIVKGRYREMIAAAHPDRGGDPELAAEINAAMEAAEKALGHG